jgi:hypothetical protein
MNARIVSFATVLDIVVLVGLGLGIIFAPLTLIWAFDDGFSTDLLMSWAAAVDIWLLGHGVPLSFTVHPDLADALSLGALSRDFTVDVALLGIGLLTLLWGFRIGRRETTAVYPLLVWTLAVGTLVLLSLALVVFMPARVKAFYTALCPSPWPTFFELDSPPVVRLWLVWCPSQQWQLRFSWWRLLPR